MALQDLFKDAGLGLTLQGLEGNEIDKRERYFNKLLTRGSSHIASHPHFIPSYMESHQGLVLFNIITGSKVLFNLGYSTNVFHDMPFHFVLS